MGMAHPALTTMASGKGKKLNAKQLKAKEEHETWLKNQGLHIDQLAKKSPPKKKPLKLNLSVDKTALPCSNGFAPGGAKKSVFDTEWQKTYEDNPEMAIREARALAEAEEKKKNIGPAYNKGAMQYLGNQKNSDLGKRRP